MPCAAAQSNSTLSEILTPLPKRAIIVHHGLAPNPGPLSCGFRKESYTLGDEGMHNTACICRFCSQLRRRAHANTIAIHNAVI
jgi:hypothetical protein